MLRTKLTPLYLAGMIDLCLIAVPAQAQNASATQQLVNQGNYWHDQGRDDLAADTWKKLLAIDPAQPDALLGLGLIDLVQGRKSDAERRLGVLQARHPGSAQAQRLRVAIGRGGDAGDVDLQKARAAAASGRYADAVKQYDAMSAGKPPSGSVALEYYQSLAGTQDGWAKARDGLGKLHAARPNDAPVALAYAQVLTYREPSRREGIAQLRKLATRSDVGGMARSSLRQALLWLNGGKADAPLYQAWLADNPNDSQVAEKLANLSKASVVSPQQRVQEQTGAGFKALGAGNLSTAEARFSEVLRGNPRDAEALGGLGSIRLKQQRFAEAQELLRKAAAGNAKWRPALDTANYWVLLRQAGSAADAGNAASASALAAQAIALRPREADGYVVRGNANAETDTAAAEADFRKALSLVPDNSGALQGLVALYARQGRADEASALFARLTPAQQEKAGGLAALQAGVQRAQARQALATGDTVAAQTALEKAMIDAPADPWVRLDLARLYQRIGRPDQARSVMDGLLAVAGDKPEALYVNALLAREGDDWNGVVASLSRIPEAKRSSEMKSLYAAGLVNQQAAQARLLMQQGRAGEAQLLLARTESALGDLSTQPDVASELAGAYADIGSRQRALMLAQKILAASPGIDGRLEYASVLMRAHQDADLSAVLRQMQGQAMTPAQSQRYQGLRNGYVLRQVDAMRELGNLEGAYEALAPVLAERPDDTAVIGALARLYEAAGDPRQAFALYGQSLQLAPNDPDTLVAAANAAAGMRDMDTAEAYLQRALALAPQSPEVLAGAGRVYRTAGKKRKAESYFQAALAAQGRAAGRIDNGLPTASTGLAYGGNGRAFNPFSGMTGHGARGNARGGADMLASMPAAAAYAPAGVALPAQVTPPASSADALPPPAGMQTAALPPVASAAIPASAPTGMALPMPAIAAAPGLNLTALPRPGEAPAPSGPTGILGELRALQAENSNSLAVAADYRGRDGESGLGRMSDLETVFEGRFGVGEGMLTATVTPTLVDAGDIDTANYAQSSRYGGGPAVALVSSIGNDSSPIDTLLNTDLYQLLMTDGNTTATQNLIYENALSSGRFQELYNDTAAVDDDGNTVPVATRRKEALALLYEDPLPYYLLHNSLSTTTIADIATDVLNNASITKALSSGEISQLKLLAGSAAAQQTPAEFQTTLYTLAGQAAAIAAGSRRLGSQDASGVGVGVAYDIGGFHADVGSTPLGFRESNIVGGVGYKGQVGDAFFWSASASRRGVNDSVLSFAGVKDPFTGLTWGGVTSTGAKLAGTVDNGLFGAYGSLGWHRLQGKHVADNDQQEFGAGVYVHALDTDYQSLTAGLNVSAMRYDKNLRGFTYGQGGYFSPQNYAELSFPVHWNGRTVGQKVAWQVDASLGVQHFKEDDSPYFPLDPELQQAAYDAASLAALLGLSTEYTAPVYAGQSKTGLSYNMAATAEWRITPQVYLGGRMELNNARDYQQFDANVYLRFLLDRNAGYLGTRPSPLRSPFQTQE